MSLRRVLLVKIWVTTILWCAPLLTFSGSLFRFVGLPVPTPIVFARLLGAAYAALIVVYVHGVGELDGGRFPVTAVRVGLVSNGLAAVLLALYGIRGAWSSWPWRGQLFMWGSLAATILLAGAIFLAGRQPSRDRP